MEMRGIFFTMDSMFALMLIVATLPIFVLISMSTVPTETVNQRLHLQAQDAVNMLSELEIKDVIREPVIMNYYSNGILSEDDANTSLIDIIGMFWASDNLSHIEVARNITEHLFSKIMPSNVKWGLSIEDESIYNTSGAVLRTVATSKKIVSGYMKEQPSTGYIAKAFLNRISGKRTASYSFFGGFVGEGKINLIVSDIPENSTVRYIYMEMNVGNNFTFYVNDNSCGNYTKSPRRFAVDNWTITNSTCLAHIDTGKNNTISIDFAGNDLSSKFIGGGYIKIAYDTTEFTVENNGRIRQYLPGIKGLINLYSSFYVPGNITSMNASIHFFNNISNTYMNIGNISIFNSPNSNYNQTINITNATFSSLLNFSKLSKNTVPFILKANLTNITTGSNKIDIMLVNDRSGSMVQSGWMLNTTSSPVIRFNNITVPRDDRNIGYGNGWSRSIEFNVTGPLLNRSVIEFEAEYPDRNLSGNPDIWRFRTSVAGYSGSGYMEAWQDDGHNYNAGDSRSPQLRYNVTFPSAGTYYVWVRGYAVDNNARIIHAGLDNATVSTADKINLSTGRWMWSRSTTDGPPATINVATAGKHTFNLWMGQDGFRADKIILTNDSSYVPSDYTLINGNLAVGIEWDRLSGVIGSEGSEFVVNLRRPDGTWIFNGGTSLPGSPDAGNYVDPPTGDAGYSNDYYSGISTKPQYLYVENPQNGTWRVSVFGWNLRPNGNPPPEMNVSIMVYLDKGNETYDDINRTETIIAWNAARDNAKLFVNLTVAEDKVGFVKFGSYAELPQTLTFNKTAVMNAIDDMGVQGGTAIHDGIDMGCDELTNHGRPKANTTWIMVLLTDGQNDDGPTPVNDSATACKNKGVTIFTIGLSAFVNQEMLRDVASDPSNYYYAPTSSDLKFIYREIATEIQARYRAQAINITGNLSYSTLYPDSYIDIYYAEESIPSEYQEISVNIDTDQLGGCNGSFFIPPQLSKMNNVKVTSFSEDYWTHNVSVKSSITGDGWRSVYQLTDYGTVYTELGDPYVVNIPENLIKSNESNQVNVLLATGPNNISSNCSLSNRVIYTARFRASTFYSDIFPQAWGSNVTVYFDRNYDGAQDGSVNIEIGKDLPSFNSTLKTVDALDIDRNAVDDAFLRLLDSMNFVTVPGNTGRSGSINNPIDIELSEDMTIETLFIGGIPYMWGPVNIGIEVWV